MLLVFPQVVLVTVVHDDLVTLLWMFHPLRLKYSIIPLEPLCQDHPGCLDLLGGPAAVIYYDEKDSGALSRGNGVQPDEAQVPFHGGAQDALNFPSNKL